MAQIEELDFKLIIDDSAFDAKIKEATKKADDLNKKLSDTLSSVKAKSTLEINTGVSLNKIKKIREHLGKLKADLKTASSLTIKVGSTRSDISGIATAMSKLATAAGKVMENFKGLKNSVEMLKAYTAQSKANAAALREAANVEKLKAAATKSATAEVEKSIAASKAKAAEEAANTAALKTQTAAEALSTAEEKKKAEVLKTLQQEEKLREAATKASTAEIKRQMVEEAKLERQAKRTNNAKKEGVSAVTKEYRTQSRLLSDIKSMAMMYFSAYGITSFLRNMVNISAEFEKQRVALSAIIRDTNKGNALFEQIKSLAVKSPFSVQELTSYTKQLSAYSIPANELYETMKMLADVSAGLGVDMNRIVLAYGQIRSASFLRGQEVRQLTEAGIPILAELAKQFEELEGRAVSAGEVFDRISKRQVTFKMVEQVFKDMTSAGGKFFQMQEKLAETLSGKKSNLVDAYQIMLDKIGEQNSGVLNAIVDKLTLMLRDYKETGREVATVTVAYNAYKIALLATATAMGKLDKATLTQKSTLLSLFKWIKTNPYVALAAALATATAWVIKHATALSDAEKITKAANDNQKEYKESVENELSTLDAYITRIKLAKEGTEQYKDAKDAFMSKYGTYLEQLKQEGKSVSTLAEQYEALAEVMTKSNNERFYTAGKTDLEQRYADSLTKTKAEANKIYDAIVKSFGLEPNQKDRALLTDYITGEHNMNELKKESDFFSKYEASIVSRSKKTRDEFITARHLFNIEMKKLKESYGMNNAGGNTTEAIEPTLFMSTVRKVLEKYGVNGGTDSAFDLWMPDDMSSEEYKKKIRGRYEELLTRKLDLGNTEKADEAKINEEIKILDEVFNSLGISKTAPTIKGAEKDQNKQESEAERSLKARISILEDLAEAYDLISGSITNAAEAEALLVSKFGEGYSGIISGLDFDTKIANAMTALAVLNPEFEETREGSAGLKAVKDYLNSKDKKEEFLSWLSGIDTNGASGSGSELKVSQILAKFRENSQKIKNTRSERELDLHNMYNSLYNTDNPITEPEFWDVMGLIQSGYITDNTENAAENIDRIDKAAQQAINVAAKLSGVTLSEANMQQLLAILAALNKISVEDLEEYGKAIDEMGGDSEEFKTAWTEMIENLKSGVKGRILKGIAELIDMTSGLTDSMAGLFDAIGDSDAANAVRGLSFVANGISSVMKALASGDTAGAILTGTTVVITAMTKLINKQEEARQKLRETMREYKLAKYDEELNGGSSIFGSNTYKSSFVARNQAIAIAKDINGIFNKTMYSNYNAKAQVTENTSALDIIKAKADSLGISLYDAYGNIDVNTLKAVQSSTNWGKKMTAVFEELIPLVEQYDDAVEKSYAAMESLLNNVASSAADAIINEWLSMGDAAADYTDILDGVAKAYAKMMVQNTLMDSIFNEEAKKELTELFNNKDYGGFMSLLKALLDSAKSAIEDVAPVLKELNLYSSSSSSSSTQESLKSLTEETGSLLASYMNAVRGDVAYGRQQRESILTELRAITGTFSATPSLSYYMTQIEAHSANTAENTRAILERLNSVMTTNGGANAIRTYM